MGTVAKHSGSSDGEETFILVSPASLRPKCLVPTLVEVSGVVDRDRLSVVRRFEFVWAPVRHPVFQGALNLDLIDGHSSEVTENTFWWEGISNHHQPEWR